MDFARFSDVSVEKKIANAFQPEKTGVNTNPAWWDLASMLKKLPKPGRDRSDSGDSDATLVGDSEERDNFTKLVEEIKRKASPPSTPLVRHISWAREPVKPPKAIFVTDYDTGKRSDLSIGSDYRGASGLRGRAPSPYPGRPHKDATEEATPETPCHPEFFDGTNPKGQRKGHNSNVKPNAGDSSASASGVESRQAGSGAPKTNSKDPNQSLTTATRSTPQVRTPSPSPTRRKPTRSTCQCPACAAATTPRRRAAPPRSRPGWVATDPSRWDDGGESAPRLLWVTPAEDPLVVDDTGTGVTRFVSTVRPERGRRAGRGHPVWAPSHSPAPGWRFAEGGGLWGVDVGELGEALKRVEDTRRREQEKDRMVGVERTSMREGGSKVEGNGRRGLAGSRRRNNASRDIRLSWRYCEMWEANCYTDMFRMHLG